MKLFPVLFATALLSACGPTASDNPTGGDGDGDSNGDGDGDGDDNPGFSVCDASSAGTPVLRRLTVREFEATFEAIFPELSGQWSSSLGTDPVSHFGFDNEASSLVVGNQIAGGIDATAASIASAVKSSLGVMLPCSATTPDTSCAGQFIDGFGKRLFRRALREDERTLYLGFFEEALAKTDFPSAVGWLTRALINAPETIYRSEVGDLDGNVRNLTQHEIATELAYTFGGTTPSDELLALADAGALTGAELETQAKQLLNSPGGRKKVHRFFEALLGYSQVTTLTKTNVPEFENLRLQMKEETDRYIDEVILKDGGGFKELLTTAMTFPSIALASFYGMPAPPADGSGVERPAGTGIGVLAQGSVLSTEAGPNSSSPTQRGLLVFEKFLCGEQRDVPPNVPDIAPPQQGVVTTRQRYEENHATGGCAHCHRDFDPIGFGFEHFDEAGRYRADEGGLPIDPSGTLPLANIPFASQESLVTSLAGMEEAQACVSSQLKMYSFGTSQACLGESHRAEFMNGTIGFVNYLQSLASEPHFTTRQAQ